MVPTSHDDARAGLLRRIGRWLSARALPLRDGLVSVMAVFGLANLAWSLVHPALDANWLWLGWAGAGWWGRVLLVVFAAAVIGWRRLPGARTERLARSVVGVVAAGCLVDTVGYYQVLIDGRIGTALPVPLSLACALVLAHWAWRPPAGERAPRARRLVAWGAAAGIWVAVVVGSLAVTDYARPADAIVVFGARVWADGRPSDALADRTRTAIALYHRGLAPVLVMSGGHGADAPISEPAAMARMAEAAGVPRSAIVLDETGLNTAGTIRAMAQLSAERGWRRMLMVTHDYHCARVKLAAAQAGLTVYTVPAVEALPLLGKPYFVVRELVAMAWYWVHPARSRGAW